MRAKRSVLVCLLVFSFSLPLFAQSGAFKIKAPEGLKKNLTAVVNTKTGEALLVFESNGKIYSSITKKKKKNPDIVKAKNARQISEKGVDAHRPTLRFVSSKNNFIFAYDTAPDDLVAAASGSPATISNASIYIGRLLSKSGKLSGSPVNFTFINSNYFSPCLGARPANDDDESQFFCMEFRDEVSYYYTIIHSVYQGAIDGDLPTNLFSMLNNASWITVDQVRYNALVPDALGILSYRFSKNDGSHFVIFDAVDPANSTMLDADFQARFLFFGDETNNPSSVTAEGLPNNAVTIWLQTNDNLTSTMIQPVQYKDGIMGELGETRTLTAGNNISGGVLYAALDRATAGSSLTKSVFYLVGLGEDNIMRLFTINMNGDKTDTAPLFTANGTITEMFAVPTSDGKEAFLFWAQKLGANDTQLWGWKIPLPK